MYHLSELFKPYISVGILSYFILNEKRIGDTGRMEIETSIIQSFKHFTPFACNTN